MATTMKTPGVYIQELDAFGNSVVAVPTAVPAFIGYTQKVTYKGQDLVNKPVRITSLMEYLSVYGDSAPKVQYKVDAIPTAEHIADLVKSANKANTKLQAARASVASPPRGADPNDLAAAVKEAESVNTGIINKINAINNAEVKALGAALKGRSDNEDQTATTVNPLNQAITAAQAAIPAVDANAIVNNGFGYTLTPSNVNYRMYAALKFFYENGGGDCYIVSTGAWDSTKARLKDTSDFMAALDILKKEPEPTMIVIPDAVEIANGDPLTDPLEEVYANAYSLQNAMINHCGDMMSRVAILDIPRGYEDPIGAPPASVAQFRTSVEPKDPKYNSYAAAYYPWLHTTVYQSSDLSILNVNEDSLENLKGLFTFEFMKADGTLDSDVSDFITDLTTAATINSEVPADRQKVLRADAALQNLSASYQVILNDILDDINLMAPSAGMAGIYTTVDNNEGVWKAPANVGIQSTIKPAIKIDHKQQEDLNMPIHGKSVCAIRAFTGMGNLVWGARTLDGNSNDWRYINVRRTLIFIEQSVQEAAKAYVFAPNDASTWTDVKSMIANFLTGLWKQGGLVGPKPADAFSVSVGLGSTMTGDDVLNGIMRVMVKVAVSRPAEFIEITFQQEMQKG